MRFDDVPGRDEQAQSRGGGNVGLGAFVADCQQIEVWERPGRVEFEVFAVGAVEVLQVHVVVDAEVADPVAVAGLLVDGEVGVGVLAFEGEGVAAVEGVGGFGEDGLGGLEDLKGR